MEETRIVNGTKYTFHITENEILAREIRDLEFNGYRITANTNGYTTEFYKDFGSDKKLIGKLIYNPHSFKFSLWKFLNSSNHIMKSTKEVGVNGALFSKLRVGDYLYFKIDSKTYKIRAGKAVKVGNYKNFEATAYNSELQFFIPLNELTEIESKRKNLRIKRKKSA